MNISFYFKEASLEIIRTLRTHKSKCYADLVLKIYHCLYCVYGYNSNICKRLSTLDKYDLH